MESDFLKVISSGSCDGDFEYIESAEECDMARMWLEAKGGTPNIDYPDEELTVYNDGGPDQLKGCFFMHGSCNRFFFNPFKGVTKRTATPDYKAICKRKDVDINWNSIQNSLIANCHTDSTCSRVSMTEASDVDYYNTFRCFSLQSQVFKNQDILYIADGRNWIVWDLDGEETTYAVALDLMVTYTPPPVTDLYANEFLNDETFALDVYTLNEDVTLPKATVSEWTLLNRIDVVLKGNSPVLLKPTVAKYSSNYERPVVGLTGPVSEYLCVNETFYPSGVTTKSFRLKQAGAYCSNPYYPDGETVFPSLLSTTDEAFSTHRAEECMNRCLRSPHANGPAVAFYLRYDFRCRCSYDCSSTTPHSGYNSYDIIDEENKRESPWIKWKSTSNKVLKMNTGVRYPNMRCTNRFQQTPVSRAQSWYQMKTLVSQS